MQFTATRNRHRRGPAPAALLLALCLLAVGAQAFDDSTTAPAGGVGPTSAPGYETPIVVRAADQLDPVVHGTRVAWQDWRNDAYYPGKVIPESDGDIYSYDLATHIEQPEGASVSTYGKLLPGDRDPVVSGAGIFWIWEGPSDADVNNEVQGRTLGGEPIEVTQVGLPSSRGLADLALDGNRLVYVLNQHRLVLYDTATRHVHTIRETVDEVSTPAVSGETIAWQQFDGVAWRLCWYRLTEGQVREMPWSSPEPLSFALGGTTLVWADHRNATWDLGALDLADPSAAERTVVAGPGDQVNPAVSGDRVVWQDNRDGDWDIYLCSLSGGPVAAVCTADGDQESPDIDGDRVVWQDRRNGDWDVYLFTLSTSTPAPVPTPEPLVITSPGTYSVAADGYDGNATPIEIRSSDVVLDGGGRTVDGSNRAGSAGIRVAGPVSDVVVKNVRLSNWETGISADGVTGLAIEGAELVHNLCGVALNGTHEAEVRETRIVASDITGLAVRDSVNVTLRGSNVTQTGDGYSLLSQEPYLDAFSSAVTVAGSDGTRIADNDLGGQYVSLELGGLNATTVTGNRLTGDLCGIISFDDGVGTTVFDNVFRSFEYPVYGNLPGTAWNVTPSPGPNVVGGPLVGGNFWADTEGTGFSETHPDANGDGFCDEPFAIPMAGTDHLPLAAWSGPALDVVPGGVGLPTDTDGDGLYDDVNGNGRADFADVVLYFNQMTWIADHEPVALFDYNANGRIDFADVVWLFNNL